MHLDKLNSGKKTLLQAKFIWNIRKNLKKFQQGKQKKIVEDDDNIEYNLWI